MGFWKSRLTGYVCLSAALALAVPIWFAKDQRYAKPDQPVVWLRAVALNWEALAPACRRPPQNVTGAVLNKLPAVKKALARAASPEHGLGRVIFFSKEPLALAKQLGREKERSFCIGSKGNIYRLRPCIVPGDGRASLWLAGGPPNMSHQTPVLEWGLVREYPAFAAYVKGLLNQAKRAVERNRNWGRAAEKDHKKERSPRVEGVEKSVRELEEKFKRQSEMLEELEDRARRRPYYDRVQSQVPVKEWQALLKESGAPGQEVKAGGYLIKGVIAKSTTPVLVEVPGLKWARLSLGGVFFILGLWIMSGLYGRKPGIRINPSWAAFFADGMFILAGATAAWGICDLLLNRWLEVRPVMDEAVQVTMAIMYLPAVAFFAYFASNMASQSLEATPQGLIRHGPGGKRIMLWEDISGFELRSSYVLVGRVGILMPRRLQTKLIIKLGEDEVSLFEPGLAAIKSQIIAALREQAPQRLHEDIEAIAAEW